MTEVVDFFEKSGRDEILDFIRFMNIQLSTEDDKRRIDRLFDEWKSNEMYCDSPGPLTSNENKDPRERILKDIFCNAKSKSYKHILTRHHYTLSSRCGGTIYDKKTYMENVHHTPSVPGPPEIWFRSLGGSVDYVNGTLHFPMRMPIGAEDLSAYTIRRQKMSAPYFLFLAAQLAFQKQTKNEEIICDQSISYIIDILLGKKSLDSKEYTPRKITVLQTKELLHAWILVYVFEKKEYLPVLTYYLYGGYVITITEKHGGCHEK